MGSLPRLAHWLIKIHCMCPFVGIYCVCVYFHRVCVCSHWSDWQRLITVSLCVTPFDPAGGKIVFKCAVCLCVFICGWVFVLLMTCQLPPQQLKVTLPPWRHTPTHQHTHTVFILASFHPNTNINQCCSFKKNLIKEWNLPFQELATYNCNAKSKGKNKLDCRLVAGASMHDENRPIKQISFNRTYF